MNNIERLHAFIISSSLILSKPVENYGDRMLWNTDKKIKLGVVGSNTRKDKEYITLYLNCWNKSVTFVTGRARTDYDNFCRDIVKNVSQDIIDVSDLLIDDIDKINAEIIEKSDVVVFFPHCISWGTIVLDEHDKKALNKAIEQGKEIHIIATSEE